MKIRHKDSKHIKGDLLPLMDCMFILLIYFIFSMLDMTNYPGLKVSTPSAKTGQKSAQAYNVLTLKNDAIYLNKELINIEDLKGKLEETAQMDMTADSKLLYIAADKTEKTHHVFKLLEELRKIGQEKIYIETLKK